VKQSPAELWSDPGGGPKATPAQLWVTKSIRVEDTFNAPGSQTVTSYKYANPRHGKDDQGQYGFRGFETVTTTSHSGARTEETFAYDVDWSGRLKKSVVFSAETPSSPTTVDVTTHTPYTSLFAGLTTFHATRLEHYVCADAQTESACTTAPVYYTRSDSTFTPKGSTGTYAAPLLYVQSATRVQHQTSPADKDRASSTSYVLAADGSTYCLRPTVTESQVQTAGVMVTFAKTEAAWDAGTAYARKLSETVWFDAATSSTTTYNFEAATGNLLSVTTPRGHTTSYEYDARKLFVAFDNTPFYTHDIEYSYEYGTGVKLETRGPNWAPCSQTNPPSCGTTILRQTSRVVVDGLGRPLETWATVNIDANTYDVRKVGIASYVDTATSTVPTSVTTQSALKQNPVTGEISYAAGRTDYDGHGRPQRITQYAQGSAGPSANDNVTVYAYRLDGTLQTVWLQDPTATSALLVPYTYTFDSLGRPTGITRPGSPSTGAATSYKAIAGTGVYTDVVEVTTTGKKAQLRRTLDADGRLVKVEEKTQESGGLPSAWAATLYEHDAAGNVSKITDAEGKITLLGHDWAGHRLFIDRGNGRKWEYTYDLGGNVSTEKSPHATACSPQPTCQAFYTTGLVYDAGERLVTRNIAPRDLSGPDIDLFGAAQETYRYDWGSLMDRNERGRMTQWAAIGLDSQTRQNQIFADDAQGNRLYNWAWLNSAGYNLTRSLAHTYTLGGAVQRTSYNESVAGDWVQTVADVGYDARGLPSTVSVSVDGGLTFLPTIIDTRNIAGLVTKRRADYPSSPTPPMAFIESVWTYDVLGRVLTQTVNKGTPGTTRVARQTLTYFGNDDVNTLRTDLGTGTGQTQTFTYDYRHQLTNVAASTHFGGTYTFGNAGRFTRAQITRGGSGRPNNDIVPRDVFYKYASTDPELVTSLNTGSASGPAFMTYTYDLAGNMLTKVEASTGNRWEYLYDGSDQLRRATKKSSTNAVLGSEEYWYDYSGNRSHLVTRNGSGTITELVWFHEGVEAHYGPPSAPSVTFAYAHTPMMRVKRASDLSTTREYQFHGLASSLLAAVDSSGTNNVIFNYAPFGEVIEAQQASGMLAQHKRRLNDKQQDDLTGLFYYGARYYDRTLMGWTQVDPLYLRVPDLGKQSTPRRSNLGVFSLNNPVRYMDPDGRDANVNALAGYRSEGENMDRDRAKNVMSEGGYVGGCANFTSQCPLIPYAAGGSGSMGPLTSRNACDGIHGVCEKPTQVEDLEAVFDPGVQLDNASRTLVPSEEAIQGAIDTIKDVSPGLGTYRSFSRGEYLMGAIGAVGDATLVGGWLSRAFSLGARAAKSTGTTFEILNGVRRAKAAELAGLKAIEAEIQIAGRQAVKASIAIEALRSPKAVIDTAGPGLNRWMDTLRRTFQGSKPPPITVQPGSRGTPIRDVVVE
ncbi:MAG: hypothetical protein JNL83_37965, partial [Myxococcales bacterium]|nr:hypothetical protein [Myxococcales bacterium]